MPGTAEEQIDPVPVWINHSTPGKEYRSEYGK